MTRVVRPTSPRVLAAVVALWASSGQTAPRGDDPLLPDPSVIRGVLTNGVRYWIAPRRGTARAAIWMRIDAGSVHEAVGEEGLAHLVEHMAFRGTRNYPDGTATRRLEALGLAFGTDENAATTLRGTTYKLALPRTDATALGDAMRILADFAYRRAPSEIDLARERRVVLEEVRDADTLEARIDNEVFAASLKGARAATRLPLGKERVVETAALRDLDAFMARWYRPERTTVLVAGDVEPTLVAGLIEREFSEFRPLAVPPVEPSPLAGVARVARSVVITDPEQRGAEVRLVRTETVRPARTVADFQRLLAERLAFWLVNRRLRDQADAGDPFDDAEAEMEPSVDGAAIDATIRGTAPASSWPALLRTLVLAVERPARAGFSETELDEARRDLLAEERSRAAGASTRPATARVAEMSAALMSGQPLMSAVERLGLTEALLPEISANEVTAALRQAFDPAERLLAVILPAWLEKPPPTARQVARVAARVALVAARGDAATARPARTIDTLLPEDPKPGEVLDDSTDAASGVTSLTLANGVRVHVRPMSDRSDEVRVQLTLAGGELLETTPSTRGLSEAAALAFDVPATRDLAPSDIRAHLAGRDIDLAGCACDGDAITAELVTGRADLEKGMRLLHLVLTQGRIAPSSLQAWKARDLEWAAREANDPELRVAEEVASAMAGEDQRMRSLTAAQIGRVDLGAAQAWLDHHRQVAPLEVAMVGDSSRDELVRLAQKYLGSLPPRPRRDERLEMLRQPRGAPPRAATESFSVDSVATRAAIAVVWRRSDARRADADALELAAAVLNERLRRDLRDRRGLTYAVSFEVPRPGALRGTNVMTARLSTEPRRAREAARVMREIVERFATEGPSPDELATARRQLQSQRSAEARRPSAWADELATLDYRAGDIGRLADPMEHLDALDSETVRSTFARSLTAAPSLAVVATPRSNLVFGARGAVRGR